MSLETVKQWPSRVRISRALSRKIKKEPRWLIISCKLLMEWNFRRFFSFYSRYSPTPIVRSWIENYESCIIKKGFLNHSFHRLLLLLSLAWFLKRVDFIPFFAKGLEFWREEIKTFCFCTLKLLFEGSSSLLLLSAVTACAGFAIKNEFTAWNLARAIW